MSFFDNLHVKGGSFKNSASANNSLSANFNRILTRKIMFPVIYHFYALRPVKEDKVIFLEIRFGELTDSYQELFNHLVRNYQMDIHCHFLRQGFVGNRQELKRQIDFIKDAATAKYLIYNDSSDTQGSFKVRKKTKVMNVWHACGAFKKFGSSTADKLYNDGKKGVVYRLHPKYDLVTVSSPEVEWAYAEAMEENPSNVKGVGVSRTDVFYDEAFKKVSAEHFYEIMPSAKNKRVILYAPTFRGIPRNATTPDMFDIEKFCKELGDEYVVLIKHHPLVKNRPSISSEYSDFAKDMTDEMTISELLCVSDICITDYSSLIFEYSLFEKPMIFFAYDLANYFDWRGFYYNYNELTPGPVCMTNAEMIDYIKHIEERFDRSKVREFREKYMSACDGHATERITEAFFGSDIEKYRRNIPLSGDYSNMPDSKTLYSSDMKRLGRMQKLGALAKKGYKKGRQKQADPMTIAFLAEENSDWDVFIGIEKSLAETNEHYEIIKDICYNTDNITDFCEKLAGAGVIYCAGEPYILRMIELRKETELIQISPEIIPAYPEYINSKNSRSLFKLKEEELFPIRSAYDKIYCSDKEYEKFFAQNYRLKDAGTFIYDKNPALSDILCGKQEDAGARLRLMIPYAKDKKVIAFVLRDREQLAGYVAKLFTKMHEDFAKDYVCVCMAVGGNPGSMVDIPDYLEGFAFDARRSLAEMVKISANKREDSEKLQMAKASDDEVESTTKNDYKNMAPLSMKELITAADKIVTDYSARAVELARALGKDVLLWQPDRTGYGRSLEAYIELSEKYSDIYVKTEAELIERLKK